MKQTLRNKKKKEIEKKKSIHCQNKEIIIKSSSQGIRKKKKNYEKKIERIHDQIIEKFSRKTEEKKIYRPCQMHSKFIRLRVTYSHKN